MRKHRSPRDRVSGNVRSHNIDDTDNPEARDVPDAPDTPDTFDPAEALESLYVQVVDLEALANAANEAVVKLPFPSGHEARQPFDRVYSLVTKVADETSAVASHGGKLMDAMKANLQRKQAGA
jgi:hypothetical protein